MDLHGYLYSIISFVVCSIVECSKSDDTVLMMDMPPKSGRMFGQYGNEWEIKRQAVVSRSEVLFSISISFHLHFNDN